MSKYFGFLVWHCNQYLFFLENNSQLLSDCVYLFVFLITSYNKKSCTITSPTKLYFYKYYIVICISITPTISLWYNEKWIIIQ